MSRSQYLAVPYPRALVVMSVLVGSLVVTARAAHGADAPTPAAVDRERAFALVWNRSPAAGGCISEAALARAVEQRVGRRVFAPAADASLVINGTAGRDPAHGAWRATLSLSFADGELLGRRELSIAAPGCGPLGQMVVLAVALMIRDRDAQAATATAPTRAPIQPPTPAAEPATVVSSTGPDAARRTWEATTDAAATFSVGLFPNPAIGVRLKSVLRPADAPVFELELAAALPSNARLGPEAGARFFGSWLGAAVCPFEWSPQPWRMRLCAGGSIGVLFFRPFGTNVPGLQRRPLVIGRVSAGVERALGRAWFIAAGAELFAPGIRDRFEIRDSNDARYTLFEMTPVGIMGALGMGHRF